MISNYASSTVRLSEIMKSPEAMNVLNEVLNSYPLYKPTSKNEYIPRIIPTREELNEALLNHYKYREIGFETVGRFLDELKISLNEIMPYYNQILFTQDQDFNIIYNVDYKRTIDTQRSGESENLLDQNGKTETEAHDTGKNIIDGNVKSSTKSEDHSETDATVDHYNKTVKSQTPGSELNISGNNIDSVSYADEAAWTKDHNTDHAETSSKGSGSTETDNKETTSTEGTQNASSTSENQSKESGTTKGTESTLETTKGNFGVVSAQDLILKYRETIRNTVQDIITDRRIAELFMLVY